MTEHKPQFDWLKGMALSIVLAGVTFAATLGARSQQIVVNTHRLDMLETSYVPRQEYDTLIAQHNMMLHKMDVMNNKLSAFIEDQARIHGKRVRPLEDLGP